MPRNGEMRHMVQSRLSDSCKCGRNGTAK